MHTARSSKCDHVCSYTFCLMLVLFRADQGVLGTVKIPTTTAGIIPQQSTTPSIDINDRQDCINGTWYCNLKIIPEVKINIGGLQETIYKIPPKTKSQGIYRHLVAKRNVSLGCGLLISSKSAQETIDHLHADKVFVRFSLISSGSTYISHTCNTTSDSGCFKIGQHHSSDVKWDHPQNHPVFFPQQQSDENYLAPNGNRNSTIMCELMLKDGVEDVQLSTHSLFEWWDLPDSISIQPNEISGFHEQRERIDVKCTSIGGYPAPDMTVSCDYCQTNVEENWHKVTSSGRTTDLVVNLRLVYWTHHQQRLRCVNKAHEYSLTGRTDSTNVMAEMEKPMQVFYLSTNFLSLYSLAEQTADVYVNATQYIFYYGNVSYYWTTDPPIPGVHESMKGNINISYKSKNAKAVTNVTCVIWLNGAPKVTEREAIARGYRQVLNFNIQWGKPNTLDIIVFVLLVVFVALAIIAVAISCTIVYLNKRRKARRGTIATEVGNSVDEDEEDDMDLPGETETKVDISPEGTVKVTMIRRPSAAGRRLSSLKGGFEDSAPSGIIGPRRGSLAERRLSVSRRRSLDVKRLSMANEALMVAETLRKSVSPKTGGRGVSFSGQGQGDEMAAMMQVEGTNIYVRKSLIPPGTLKEPEIDEAEEDQAGNKEHSAEEDKVRDEPENLNTKTAVTAFEDKKTPGQKLEVPDKAWAETDFEQPTYEQLVDVNRKASAAAPDVTIPESQMSPVQIMQRDLEKQMVELEDIRAKRKANESKIRY